MCGIVGFLNSHSQSGGKESLDSLIYMAKAILPRGPDSVGYWHDSASGIYLGHRRLSILDLSTAGNQPMLSACGRYVIAFNGEIYNHLVLRKALDQVNTGYCWRGHSDTETLLACIELWGVDSSLSKLVGMFAFALWDKERRTLTLARDRFGEKPLYWGRQGNTLFFGSELKALKAHPDFAGEVDRNALALLLRYNYIPTPHSIYKGIFKLPAGHSVTIPHGSRLTDVEPKAYWCMDDVILKGLENPFVGNDEQAVAALENKLIESINLQMLADVPLGAFLSGGVDSSTVVALMQRQSLQQVRTFAIGFDSQEYDEAGYAKAIARHLGTDHTELYVGDKEALAVIPGMPSIYCEPFADSSQIPTYLLSNMARKTVAVALSGDGGDELFGGYNSYDFLSRIWRFLALIPAPFRSALQSALSGLPLPTKLLKFREVMAARTPQDLYRQVQSHWAKSELLVLGSKEPSTLLNAVPAWPKDDNFAHWMMAVDTQTYLADDILTKVDRAAMANSLETRIPLLDHRIVELAWRFPFNMKIRNGQSKWILRQVLYKYVPKELIERPKKGFSVPLGAWLRGPLRDWSETLLGERRLKMEGYFNPILIRKAWLAHLEGKVDNSNRLWSVLMFQAWLEEQRHD